MFGRNKIFNLAKGGLGEKLAAEYLEKKGYKILEFNFQNRAGLRLGEVDIIAKKNGELFFVEVKTRIGNKYKETLPEENINRAKLYKLTKIAQFYIRANNLWSTNYHFDAVTVWLAEDKKSSAIRHLEDIFF